MIIIALSEMIPQKTFLKRTWPILIQFAEAHRKPRWVPVAKSKMFRIPKRPVITEEERLELLRVNNNYKTQMRAIRRFYYEEMIRDKSTKESGSSEMSQRLEAEEWDRCVKLNEKWNTQVAIEREQRNKVRLTEMEEFIFATMEKKDMEQKALIEKASQEIRKQKELSLSFIRPENLDEAIDHALANPKDYNFAIDLQGNQYQGRDQPIEKQKDHSSSSNV